MSIRYVANKSDNTKVLMWVTSSNPNDIWTGASGGTDADYDSDIFQEIGPVDALPGGWSQDITYDTLPNIAKYTNDQSDADKQTLYVLTAAIQVALAAGDTTNAKALIDAASLTSDQKTAIKAYIV